MNDKKYLIASYIVNFNESIIGLNSHYSRWRCFSAMIKDSKFGSEIEAENLKSEMNNVRFYLHSTYILAKAMLPPLNIQIPEKIHELYKKLDDAFSITIETITEIIDFYNRVFVDECIKDLIISSNEVLQSVIPADKYPQS